MSVFIIIFLYPVNYFKRFCGARTDLNNSLLNKSPPSGLTLAEAFFAADFETQCVFAAVFFSRAKRN